MRAEKQALQNFEVSPGGPVHLFSSSGDNPCEGIRGLTVQHEKDYAVIHYGQPTKVQPLHLRVLS